MFSPFIESLRRDIRLRGYSMRTEKTYLYWVRFFIHFHQRRHPQELGAPEVKAFLSYLASERNVAINTQKVALNALVFLYKKFLQQELGELGFTLATRQRCLPCVLTPPEVMRILAQLSGQKRLIIELLYGSGLRISECLRLRVQDIDFDRLALSVRDSKGHKYRQTLLSSKLLPDLQLQVKRALEVQVVDNEQGVGPSMPYALGKKYPNAYRTPLWAFIFPSKNCVRTLLPVCYAGTTCINQLFVKRCSPLLGRREFSIKRSIATPSAIRLPLTYYSRGLIFEAYRSSWVTTM